MEGRLGSKIDSTNRKVDRALLLVAEMNTALEDLELKVATTEKVVEEKLEEGLCRAEARIKADVENRVKTLILDQLRGAGFDPGLSAGDLSTLRTTRGGDKTYASAVTASTPNVLSRM